MPHLKIRSGLAAGTEFSFSETVVVGRGPMADLSLDDPTVSRRHAVLSWDQDECVVSDLESANGTFLNDDPVSEPTRLDDGDLLRLGAVVAEYRGDRDVREPAPSRSSDGTQTSVRLVEVPEGSSEVLVTVGPGVADEEEDRVEGSGKDPVARRLARRLRFFNDLGEVISATLDDAALLSFVVDRLLEVFPAGERSFVMVWDDEREELVPGAARTPDDPEGEIAASQTLLDEVRRRREGVLYVESTGGEKYADAQSLHDLRIRSAMCVPLLFRDEFLGAMQVDCRSAAGAFEESDLSLMMGVGSHVAMFLAHAKLHERQLLRDRRERDMMMARKVQRQFLPDCVPTVAGYTFSIEYSPALAVGGDFYTFLELEGGRTGVAVGDVSGKGVPAALYVAKLTSEMRFHSVGRTDPGEILSRVNRALVEEAGEGGVGMFVTMVLAVLDPEAGTLMISSAGHPPPLVRDAEGGVVERGAADGPPLGLDETPRLEHQRYRLARGDVVVLYTDGVTEAENRRGTMFGDDRLRQAVGRGRGTVGVRDEVLSAVKEFAGDAPQSDDVTLVCFGPRAG